MKKNPSLLWMILLTCVCYVLPGIGEQSLFVGVTMWEQECFFGWLFLLFHRHLCTVWDSGRLTRVATAPDFVYSFLVSSAVNKLPVHHHQSPVFGSAFNLQLHSLLLPRSLTEESSLYGSCRLLPAQELWGDDSNPWNLQLCSQGSWPSEYRGNN